MQRLGLPFNSAKVYVALFRVGLSTAKTISKKSGVERSETYRIMAKLEKRGLVEKIISTPCKFRAISIRDAFSILMECRMRESTDLRAEISETVEKFKNCSATTALEGDEARFSLFSEQAAVRRKEKTLDKVQRSFDVVSSWRNPHSVIFIEMEQIVEALQRGVKIRVIIDKPDEEKLLSDVIKRSENYPNFKIRHLLNPPKALMSIYDKKIAWVCTCTNPTQEECPTLRSTNPCLLAILQDYFEMMWLTVAHRN